MSGIIESRPVEAAEMDWVQKGLSNVGFFSKLGREELTAVLPYMLMIRYEAGAVICGEGEPGDALYLVYKGQVVVSKKAWTEPVAILKDGDFFGEMSLLFGEPRSATVTAQVDTEVFCLASLDFLRIVESKPEMVRTLRALAQSRRDALARS